MQHQTLADATASFRRAVMLDEPLMLDKPSSMLRMPSERGFDEGGVYRQICNVVLKHAESSDIAGLSFS